MTNSESAARDMADAAAAFLAGLDEQQRSVAHIAFDDEEERRNWHYIPRTRGGLAFAAMSSVQEKAAYDLLGHGLGDAGFAAATAIIGLEDVLDRIEGGRGPRRGRPGEWGRHRADYSTTIFGDPQSSAGPWGWRFEGHHVSINVTVAGADIAIAPCFLGANPAETRSASGLPVTRPLAAEEDLALALVRALDAGPREQAQLPHDAPDDILTEAAPRLDEMPALAGARLADLGPSASAGAEALVHHYVHRLPARLAEKRWQQLRPDLGDVRFAFAGTAEHLRPQYYRLAGVPNFFVEYDNTQNDANHVHTVVRDPQDDFGDDVLRTHRRADHP